MRKVIRAFVLALALCGPVFAGDMPTPPAVQPPPNAPTEPTTEGEIHNPPLVMVVLTLLSLF